MNPLPRLCWSLDRNSHLLVSFSLILLIFLSDSVNGRQTPKGHHDHHQLVRSHRPTGVTPSVKPNSKNKPRFKWILDKPFCVDPGINAKVDSSIQKLVGFGPKGRKFPQHYNQVKPYCNETRQLLTYIDTFLYECFTPDVQKLASVVIYTLKRHLRIFCNKKSTHKKLSKLLSLMPCLNKYVHDDSCIQQVMNQTQLLIPASMSSKNKIKHVCCYYTEFVKCSDDWLEAIPCVKRDKEVLLDFLRGLSGDIVSLACGEYNEYTDRCDSLTKVQKDPNLVYKDYGSYLLLMIDMIESMDSLLGDTP